MSMLGNFRQVSSVLLERIKARPALVEQVVRYRPMGTSPESDAEAFISLLPAHMRKALEGMPAEMRAGFLAQIDASVEKMPGIVKDQIAAARRPKGTKPTAASAIDPGEVGAELDLEKAWHGVHYLLCGSSNDASGPFGSAVLGGQEIGEDLGYGPARYLEPSEVKTISGALASVTTGVMAARFDAAVMDQNKVYPGRWVEDDGAKEWLCDAFSQLQAFYSAAAEGGYALLLYIL